MENKKEKKWFEFLAEELDKEKISEKESTKNEIRKLLETKLDEVGNE